jgi:hypothetical protein
MLVEFVAFVWLRIKQPELEHPFQIQNKGLISLGLCVDCPLGAAVFGLNSLLLTTCAF